LNTLEYCREILPSWATDAFPQHWQWIAGDTLTVLCVESPLAFDGEYFLPSLHIRAKHILDDAMHPFVLRILSPAMTDK